MRAPTSVVAAVAVVVVVAGGCGSSGRAAPSTTAGGSQDAFGIIGADPSGTPVTQRFVIPPGTALRLDAGEAVDILPARLHYRVGQVIQVVNEDDRGETVGPFVVAAHTTVTERFATTGRYAGLCTVHPGGKIEIDVTT